MDGVRDKRGIVSLTFDGPVGPRLEEIVLELGRHEVPGVFYVPAQMLLEHLADWRDLHLSGHEIGNGALMGFAEPDGSLPRWTLQAVREDVADEARLLRELFPSSGASFGVPGPSHVCNMGEDDYLPAVLASHGSVRTCESGVNPWPADPARLRSVRAEDADVCIEIAAAASDRGDWAIFRFAQFGGRQAEVLRRLLRWLAENSGAARVVTVAQGTAALDQAATKR